MPLSHEDVLELRKAGFITHEIRAFDQAKAPDGTPQVISLQAATWRAMIASRRGWVAHMRVELKWSDRQIAETIRRYYKMKVERTPFDFLKVEYKPPRRLTDYQKARKKRARAEVRRLYK